MTPLLPLATGHVMRESLWLERDDETALLVRQRWVNRAKRRAAVLRSCEPQHLTDAMVNRIYAAIVRETRKHPLGHEVEHWDADAETCLKSLILPSRFSEETTP